METYVTNREGTLVYHYDHLGSTRKITDISGTVQYEFRYGTYGELLSIVDCNSQETMGVEYAKSNRTFPQKEVYCRLIDELVQVVNPAGMAACFFGSERLPVLYVRRSAFGILTEGPFLKGDIRRNQAG